MGSKFVVRLVFGVRVYGVGVRIRVEELRTGVVSIVARHWLRVA